MPIQITAGAGDNFILGDDGQINFVGGAAGSALLFASATDGNELIITLGGRDIIYTGDGDNTVFAGSGNDDIVGGLGIDTLNGQNDSDFIVGMLGDDTLDGGSGNDVMFGGVPVGVRDDYELNTGDFVLPPEYQSTEALYSSNPATFGQTGITTGGYIPSIRITPALFLGAFHRWRSSRWTRPTAGRSGQ